jgi:hypothetical protein
MWDKVIGQLIGASRAYGLAAMESTMTKQNNNTTVTIADVIEFLALPATIACKVNDDGLTNEIPVRDIVTAHPHMIRYGLLSGMMGKLGNVSKGGLKAKLGRDATDKDLHAARAKIVDEAWMNGTWNLSGSGPRDSISGEMRDAYIAKQVSLGRTVKQAESAIRETVTAAFGKDEKATFVRFLDAVATIKAKAEGADDYDTIRQSLEASAMEAVEAERKRAAESKDALADLDVADLF